MTVSSTQKPQKPLLGKFRLASTLIVETGLHIGGGNETLSIGGLDKPVIRDPLSRHPYLPGSSIKGKLRSILERLLNKPLNRQGSRDTYRYESDDLADGFTEISSDQFVPFEGARTCQVSRLFGSTGSNKCWIETNLATSEKILAPNSKPKIIDGVEHSQAIGRNAPAKLIVRDCHLTDESAEDLKITDTGLYMTEWKFENGIDRITAAANPRQVERVPQGAKFNFEMVYTVENESQVEQDLKNLAIALAILEDDALGGHGSRGYGKIRFENFNFFYRDVKHYQQNLSGSGSDREPIESRKNIEELLENFGSLNKKIQERLLPENRSEA